MKFTIKAGIDENVKTQFINQSIIVYKIQRISIEPDISADAINIETTGRESALSIMRDVVTPDNFEIDLGEAPNSTITLWV